MKTQSTSFFKSIKSPESITPEKENVKRHVSLTTNEQQEEQQETRPKGYKTLVQEITDTLIAKNNDANDPTNYIRAAKLYSCQGYQQEAANILEEGLRVITDTRYSLMYQQELDKVKSRLKRRIDFIAQCPYEIVHNILERLASYHKDMIIICLKVSTTWYQRLLNQKQIWRSIQLDDSEFGNHIHQILPNVSNLVEHLQISINEDITYKKRIEPFKKYPFNNLKSLKIITDSNLEQNYIQLLSDDLSIILPNVANTLETLELEIPSCKEISLECLLTACPKLTRIRLDVHTVADDDINEIHVPDTISLTSLHLATNEVIPTTVLEPLFRHSPHLRFLNLCSTMEQNILEILGDMCPELTEIKIYDDKPLYHDFSDMPEPIMMEENHKGALRHLKIDNIQSAIPLDFRLAKSNNTLHTLCLAVHPFYGQMTTFDDWKPFSLYMMNQLRTLEITTGPSAFCQLLPTILSRTPALQELYLFSLLIAQDDQVTRDTLFDSIGDLTMLATLEIANIQINGHGFERMLIKQGSYATTITQEEKEEHKQKMISRTDVSNVRQPDVTNNNSNDYNSNGLQCLRIDYCRGFEGSMFRNIAKIKSLNQVSVISTEENQVNEIDLADFIHSIDDNLPLVATLHLDNMPFTTDMAKNMTKWDPKYFKNITLGSGMIYNHVTKYSVEEILNDHFGIKFKMSE